MRSTKLQNMSWDLNKKKENHSETTNSSLATYENPSIAFFFIKLRIRTCQ